jgi:uncharacterized membrane protein YraQ (UPF0718 family)/copper chaperone CopZ
MGMITGYIIEFFRALVHLTAEMAPYLMLGFLFAGIMFVWFPRKKVYKYLGKPNSASVINAALIGIPLPLCSCGVIPTGISFYNSGASKGSSVSFLISTPQTGIDSIMVTYSLLGLPMAVVKPLIALVTGFFGGFFTNILGGGRSPEELKNSRVNGDDDTKDRSLAGMLRYAFVEFLEDIAKWLVIGLLIAALIDVVVPDSFFTTDFGNEYLAMVLILVAAIPLYVCATGSVPIAAVLMLKGLSPGAAIVFLMAGPATNAATMTVIGKVLGRKTLLVYLATIIAGSLFFGILVNELLPREWFTAAMQSIHKAGHAHELIPVWLKWSSSILLTGFIMNALIRKYLLPFIGKPPDKSSDAEREQKLNDMKIIVKGMTCNHCKSTVEENVRTIHGVESVNADIVNDTVTLEGEGFDLEEVRRKIESLGYKFVGKLG